MEYVTKTEKEQDKFSTGMKRCSQKNKIRYDLVIPLDMKINMLDRWAELMARGMSVYGERNWELASTQEELDRFRASAFRHFIQWFKGETDEDHAAAILFNVQGAEFVKEKLENKNYVLGYGNKWFDTNGNQLSRPPSLTLTVKPDLTHGPGMDCIKEKTPEEYSVPAQVPLYIEGC